MLRLKKQYSSYEEAMRHTLQGYENQELTDLIFRKTVAYRAFLAKKTMLNTDMMQVGRFFLTLLQRPESKQPLQVLDIGGACGAIYFELRRFLDILEIPQDLRWRVVETPAMIKQAKRLSSDEVAFSAYPDLFAQPEFVTGHWNVALLASTLQYIQEPQSFLARLCTVIRPEQIFITRTPLVEQDTTIFAVQSSDLNENGPGRLQGIAPQEIDYPVILTPKKLVCDVLSQHGYEIQLMTPEEGTLRLSQGKETGVTVREYSILAKRRKVEMFYLTRETL